MKIQDVARPLFLRRLLATPQGRAHYLNQAADAEDSDEGRIFDVLLAGVDDAELQRMVRRHRDDEKRHARMFRECLERTGFEPFDVPSNLKLIDRLSEELGGFFDNFEPTAQGVTEAYALLQVIEERAITQFKMIEPHMRRVDPLSADVIAEISHDELRHLKYCRAVTAKYASDELSLQAMINRFREVEARVFGEVSRANMAHALEHGLLDVRPAERLAWRGLLTLSVRAGHSDPTPYAATATAA